MKIIDKIALVLIIIGAINWGLIALFELDLVALLFGEMTILSRIVYGLVGLSGLWGIKLLFDDQNKFEFMLILCYNKHIPFYKREEKEEKK